MTDTGSGNQHRSIWPTLFVVVFVVVAVAGIGLTVWSRAQGDRIRTEYQSRGLPTSLQELDAWYTHVPDAENAAMGFLAAGDAVIPIQTEAERNLPIVGSPKSRGDGVELNEEELQAAREYLMKNAHALELARPAALLKSARYPINLTLGPAAVDTKPLESVRNAARLFWLEGLVRAHEKDTAGAVESFAEAYAVGRSLSGEPLLISQFVVVAIETGTAKQICNALSIVEFPPKDLDKLAEVVSQSPGASYYGRAIAGEGVFALFDRSSTNPFQGPLGIFDRSAYARTILSLFDASSLDLKDAIVRIEAMSNVRYSALRMRLHPLSLIITPAFTRAFDSTVRAQIYRDLLLIVIALEKHRRESGGLPENLTQIVPRYIAELPKDPYAPGMYLYLREEKGYTVYSVGPDRVDGHGEKEKGAGKGDIPLRVAR